MGNWLVWKTNEKRCYLNTIKEKIKKSAFQSMHLYYIIGISIYRLFCFKQLLCGFHTKILEEEICSRILTAIWKNLGTNVTYI